MTTLKRNGITRDQISTPVKDFYRNKQIFLTGATGFLGQVIIEKLLRCCDVDKLYILIRSKKGKTWQQRIDDICADPVSVLSYFHFRRRYVTICLLTIVI